jgi:hypothetical protein
VPGRRPAHFPLEGSDRLEVAEVSRGDVVLEEVPLGVQLGEAVDDGPALAGLVVEEAAVDQALLLEDRRDPDDHLAAGAVDVVLVDEEVGAEE